MKIWSKGLDDKFSEITTGSNDITGASQLQNVSNFHLVVFKPNNIFLSVNCFCIYEYVKLIMYYYNSPGVQAKFQWTNTLY